MASDQRGLTLVEILVSLIILSGGAVYVVLALARSAEVEKRLEDRYPVYPLLAAQIAESEMRVTPQKDPLKGRKGSIKANNREYDWSVETRFQNPDDEKALKEQTISSALLHRTIEAGWNNGAVREGMILETYSRVIIPESETA